MVTPLVTFAIPLRRPNSVIDRKRLDWTLAQTLRSIFNQSHSDFRVLIASSYSPELPSFVDQRLEILDYPGFQPQTWEEANVEAGRRRQALARRFAAQGGGYLMFVDHDDFISRQLAEHIRNDRHPYGYVVQHGYLYDAARNGFAPYPMPEFEGDFHRFCGTSIVERLTPEDVLGAGDGQPPLYNRVHGKGHHHVFDLMLAEGRSFATFPFPAVVYARNTGDNLSRFAKPPDNPDRERWIDALDKAVFELRIADDERLREEFAIPAEYSPPAPSHFAFSLPQPRLSILLCTYRRPAGLRRALKALVPQLGGDRREVIVVNDGSHDEAYAAVVDEYAAHIRYRALKENGGIAAARNAAAQMATGDYLVFTDDDCEPPPFWLDWLAARLTEHPELELVAGTTRALWPDKPSFFARVRAAHDLIPTTAQVEGTIIFPTANVAIRRNTFEALGGFGFPNFEGAGEDTELATRLSLHGAASLYDASWYTRHEISEGLFALCRRYRRYGYANGRLIALTTSPPAHDYMQTTWRSNWRTIWRWEIEGRLKDARAVHSNRAVARLSATLACIVRMAYWRGVKDAFAA